MSDREKELLQEIEKLRKENEELKNARFPITNIMNNVSNQQELSFLSPYYETYLNANKWRRGTTSLYNHIRNLAMSTADRIDGNRFYPQKVKDLSDDDARMVVKCAEETISVVAKYKKQYLIKYGRKDIIEAFELDA